MGLKTLRLFYRILTSDHSSRIPEKSRDKLLSEYPQIEAATKVLFNPSPVLYEEENHDLRVVHTDSGFFRVFSLNVVSGQRDHLFRDPHQAVLTQSAARRIFGEANPVGEILNVSHEYDLEVVAVGAILVAILTVSWQSWRASRRNPVEALRYE